MTAWYITRVKSKFNSILYYVFVFAMIVPFQMVMFTMSKTANDLYLNSMYGLVLLYLGFGAGQAVFLFCGFVKAIPFQMVMFTLSKLADMLHLGNPLGIVVVYLGFGAGLSVFMFCGFVKSIPLEIEEAAMIDGCTPIQTFFQIVMPILKPTAITVAILNAMWIWNDYLLPSLILPQEKGTIPMVIQNLKGGYGSIDMGAMMAMLVLAIVPIIIFYLSCQKYIIKGVAAGAVKG